MQNYYTAHKYQDIVSVIKNRDERWGGGVEMYIRDTIKYKKWQILSKLDETIEHMWIECQGNNKNKNYLVDVFYQPHPEDKERLI